jgi:hypothetical protein
VGNAGGEATIHPAAAPVEVAEPVTEDREPARFKSPQILVNFA